MKNNGTSGNKDMVAEIKFEFKRHTNILMEQVHREVKIVAEGHGAIIRKLEEHDKRFDKVDAKFAAIDSELNTIKMALMDTSHHVDRIEKRVDRTDQRVANLEKRFDHIDDVIGRIEKRAN